MNRQVYEEAAELLVELRVGAADPRLRERLDAWFRESPHHIRAFLEISSIWEDGGDPDLDRSNDAAALIARARAAANIIALQGAERETRVVQADSRRARDNATESGSGPWFTRRFAAMASAATVCAAAIGLAVMTGYFEPTYVTGTGEQKTVDLPDGSKVQLNSRSHVRIRFSARARTIDLLAGQALFEVAKDAARPFVVRSDSTRVRAIGTRFDVYRKTNGTIVTVVEGRVAVLPPGERRGAAAEQPAAEKTGAGPPEAAAAIFVSAGEQVTVTSAAVTQSPRVDVAAATAWTQRELVFDYAPLGEVTHEFNRYNVRQLVVKDAQLEDFHVTGVFSSTDPGSLLNFLRAQRGIGVEETGSEIRIVKK